MKVKRKTGTIFVYFILLYYIYMNSMRNIMIPYSSITIPIILVLAIIVTIYYSNAKIKLFGTSDKIICFSWLAIIVYILLNNTSIKETIIDGGIIQLLTVFLVMLFADCKTNCDGKWIKLMQFFIMFHAVATIVFYYNSELYFKYISIMFSGDVISNCIKYYNYGYMTGLSTHFSSNGMILGMGLLITFSLAQYYRKSAQKEKTIFQYVLFVIILYALILSSKRSPLFAAFFSIIITYIIAERKNVFKRLFVLVIVSLALGLSYNYLVDIVPGLSTISDKNIRLESGGAGILNGRMGLWNRSLEMFKDKPIIGYGYGSYSDYAIETNAITTSAHNQYLQILAELGILGFILYGVAFVFGLKNTITELKYSKDLKTKINMNVNLEIQLYVLIYCFTATSLMYYSILIPLFIAYTSMRSIRINRLECMKGGDKN